MQFIINLAISMYITSTIVMLRLYFGTKREFAKMGMDLQMPIGIFLWTHFMPIVHTVALIKIMLKAHKIEHERGQM